MYQESRLDTIFSHVAYVCAPTSMHRHVCGTVLASCIRDFQYEPPADAVREA
ncbi:hypothetical protein PGB90_006730 [Kerria lacca]